jgi:hypothetical protein
VKLEGVKLADSFVADPVAAGEATTKAAPEVEDEPSLILRQAVGVIASR